MEHAIKLQRLLVCLLALAASACTERKRPIANKPAARPPVIDVGVRDPSGKFRAMPFRGAGERDVATRMAFLKQMPNKAKFRVLFIGNSLTFGWAREGRATWERLLEPLPAANFGVPGSTIEHLLWRIDHGELSGTDPSLIVLLIGTNNRQRPERIFAGIKQVVRRLLDMFPKVHVIVHGIPPRQDSKKVGKIMVSVNRHLEGWRPPKRARYLFDPAVFSNEKGPMNHLYRDGLHLTKIGYRRWALALVPIIRRRLAGPAK